MPNRFNQKSSGFVGSSDEGRMRASRAGSELEKTGLNVCLLGFNVLVTAKTI